MRKKGGMELSINAIVILIIAMVVLGIGILFIRGMFGKAQTTTFKALTAQETTVPASSDRPLVADKELEVSSSKPSATLQVSVYNPFTSAEEGLTVSLSECKSTNQTQDITIGEEVAFTNITIDSIKPNTFQSFQTVFTVLNFSAVPVGDALACTLRASNVANGGDIDVSTSVIVKVSS